MPRSEMNKSQMIRDALKAHRTKTPSEIAEILNSSERSVQREWSYAKAWLFERIERMKSG